MTTDAIGKAYSGAVSVDMRIADFVEHHAHIMQTLTILEEACDTDCQPVEILNLLGVALHMCN